MCYILLYVCYIFVICLLYICTDRQVVKQRKRCQHARKGPVALHRSITPAKPRGANSWTQWEWQEQRTCPCCNAQLHARHTQHTYYTHTHAHPRTHTHTHKHTHTQALGLRPSASFGTLLRSRFSNTIEASLYHCQHTSATSWDCIGSTLCVSFWLLSDYILYYA